MVMSDLGDKIKFRVWDGELIHDVSELFWSQGGLRWCGPDISMGKELS